MKAGKQRWSRKKWMKEKKRGEKGRGGGKILSPVALHVLNSRRFTYSPIWLLVEVCVGVGGATLPGAATGIPWFPSNLRCGPGMRAPVAYIVDEKLMKGKPVTGNIQGDSSDVPQSLHLSSQKRKKR